MPSPSSLLGAAGEHFVMSQLLRRGFIAALAPTGVPMADIIVTNDLGDRLSAIQVKTRRNLGSDGGWHMKAKHENEKSKNLFYVFVDFGTDASHAASSYVIPSIIVANALSTSHQVWLATPGRGGQAHKDGVMRRFLPSYEHLKITEYGKGWIERYRGAWELLRHPV